MMGGGGQKIGDHVDFPLDGLDLSKYTKCEQTGVNMISDCYAVANHFGNMGFGHYTAFARSPNDDQWYEFDDSRVSQLRSDPR